MVVDALHHYYDFPPFTTKFNALVSVGKYHGEPFCLFKPQTFMNLSGQDVQALLSFYKLDPSSLIVIHDDLDLLPFCVKIKHAGGSGGHNGLKSVDQHLGNAYWRLRIGIGRPLLKEMVSQYVLSPFSKEEQKQLPDFLEHLTAHTAFFLDPKAGTYTV